MAKTVMVQGRIVWTSGDLFKGRIKTVFGTQTPMLNQKGETVNEYGFGLAIPKSVLNQTGAGQPGEIWAALHEEAFTLFPSRQIPPSFAMKFKDGDGIDDQGQPFANREGYAGCIVLACTTRIPIKFFKFENNQNIQINEGIKCGDYVNVQLTVEAHPAIGSGKAGLYVNPNAVQFLGYGKEIINAPSGDQVFGVKAPALPPGASATPIVPAGLIMPTPAQPQPYAPMGTPSGFAAPQAVPQMQHMAPPMQQAVAPHYAVVPQQFQNPQVPTMPGVQSYSAPAPQAPQMPAMPGYQQHG